MKHLTNELTKLCVGEYDVVIKHYPEAQEIEIYRETK